MSNRDNENLYPSFLPSFLPLSPTAQGELWPPEQSASILLYSSSVLPIVSLSFCEDHHAHLPTIPTMKIYIAIEMKFIELILEITGFFTLSIV
jgi:hypothetical protein